MNVVAIISSYKKGGDWPHRCLSVRSSVLPFIYPKLICEKNQVGLLATDM